MKEICENMKLKNLFTLAVLGNDSKQVKSTFFKIFYNRPKYTICLNIVLSPNF